MIDRKHSKLQKCVKLESNTTDTQLHILMLMRNLKVFIGILLTIICIIVGLMWITYVTSFENTTVTEYSTPTYSVYTEESELPDILYEAYLITYPGVIYCDFTHEELQKLYDKYTFREVNYVESEFFAKTLLQNSQIVFPTLIVRKVVKGTVVGTEIYYGRQPILQYIDTLDSESL